MNILTTIIIATMVLGSITIAIIIRNTSNIDVILLKIPKTIRGMVF